VRNEGYSNPTPIQEQAIPHVLAGRDVLGCARPAPARPPHSRCRFCRGSKRFTQGARARAWFESSCSRRPVSSPARLPTAFPPTNATSVFALFVAGRSAVAPRPEAQGARDGNWL